MYICAKNKNKIDIYKMEAKLDDIGRYKEEVIKSNQKNLLYKLYTNVSKTMQDFKTSSVISLNKINYEDYRGTYYKKIIKSCLIEEFGTANLEDIIDTRDKFYFDDDMLYYSFKNEWKLNNYLDGIYDTSPLIKVIDSNEEEKYYFLKTEESKENKLSEEYHMDGLINLPLKLYILHLLLQRKFSNLKDRDISEQLSLFNIDYYKSFSLNDIHDLINCGLINATYEKTMQKVATDSLILKRIKK